MRERTSRSFDRSSSTHGSDSTDEMLKKCRKYFQEVDCDNSGVLDVGEFGQMLRKIGVSIENADVVRMYKKADKDGDGELTFREFLDAFTSDRSIGDCSSGNYASNNHSTGNHPNGEVKKAVSKPTRRPRHQSPLNVECHAVTDDDVRIGCSFFWRNDVNADGFLDITEYAAMLRSLGMRMSRLDIEKAFRIVDKKNDGYATFMSFVDAYINKIKPRAMTEEKIKGIFEQCDQDHKGYLSEEEFGKLMEMLGCPVDEKRIKRLQSHVTTSDNGFVNLKNLCHFLGMDLKS